MNQSGSLAWGQARVLSITIQELGMADSIPTLTLKV